MKILQAKKLFLKFRRGRGSIFKLSFKLKAGLQVVMYMVVIIFVFYTKISVAQESGFIHRGTVPSQHALLLDGQGKVVRLQGFNLGGWLDWEGWLWGGSNSITKLIAPVRDLSLLRGMVAIARDDVAAQTALNAFPENIYAQYINADDFRAIAASGANVVHVPFNHSLFERRPADPSVPAGYAGNGFTIFDHIIRMARENNLMVIFAMMSSPCGQNAAVDLDPESVPGANGEYAGQLWQNAKCRKQTIMLWERIAKHYANEKVIAAWDLLEEPITPANDKNSLYSFYRDLIKAVRGADRNHLLLIQGGKMDFNWNHDLKPFYLTKLGASGRPQIIDDNMAFSMHQFSGVNWPVDPHNVTDYLEAAAGLDEAVPVVLTSYGENSAAKMNEAVSLFDHVSYKGPNGEIALAGRIFWVWKKAVDSPQYWLMKAPALNGFSNRPQFTRILRWITKNQDAFRTPSVADDPKPPKDMTPALLVKELDGFIEDTTFSKTMQNQALYKALGLKVPSKP